MPRNVELRFGAVARRTEGEWRELFNYVAGNPTRERFAGGETWTGGLFAEASADLGRLTLTGGARIDHWQVSDGHLFERTIATGEVLRDEKYDRRDGWLPTARGGVVWPIADGWSLRSAVCADPGSSSPPRCTPSPPAWSAPPPPP